MKTLHILYSPYRLSILEVCIKCYYRVWKYTMLCIQLKWRDDQFIIQRMQIVKLSTMYVLIICCTFRHNDRLSNASCNVDILYTISESRLILLAFQGKIFHNIQIANIYCNSIGNGMQIPPGKIVWNSPWLFAINSFYFLYTQWISCWGY